MPGARLLDKIRNALHFLVVLRDETFETLRIVDKTRLCFLGHEVDNLSEHGLCRKKQRVGNLSTALIPTTESFPFVAILPRPKNVAFGREDEIWADRELKMSQTRVEQADRATSIDCPHRAGVLQFANQFHALRIENRFADARNERAIKIQTEKLNS